MIRISDDNSVVESKNQTFGLYILYKHIYIHTSIILHIYIFFEVKEVNFFVLKRNISIAVIFGEL